MNVPETDSCIPESAPILDEQIVEELGKNYIASPNDDPDDGRVHVPIGYYPHVRS